MRIRKLSAAIALAASAFGLSACATALDTRVTRYQAMPAPQGQTFIVVPGEGMAANGGLEFQRYAGIVAQQLAARGYTPAATAQGANMVVHFGYGVDRGQVRYVSDPFGPYGYGRGYGYGGYGSYWGGSRFFRPRFGYWGSPFYYGWDDPFWYGGGIDSYVEYHPQVDLHIRAAGTNQPLFDGRVQARSQTDRLDAVLPSMIEALFTGFPGRSGETVKITIPARQTAR
jgi:hypothetical protein